MDAASRSVRVTRVTQDVRPSSAPAGFRDLLGKDHTRSGAEAEPGRLQDSIKSGFPRRAAPADAGSRSCPDADLRLPGEFLDVSHTGHHAPQSQTAGGAADASTAGHKCGQCHRARPPEHR